MHVNLTGSHAVCSRCLQILHREFKLHSSTWTSKSVRSTFLEYFCKKQDHLYVPSSSVIPRKGQGTYFTNAGMNQFKPIFLGTLDDSHPMSSYTRVSNSQRCIRVGGKHNDLDDVGRDLTHHTFFEMLGSWSFGDYFKEEACRMALDLLTTEYKLSIDRLYFTFFSGSEELGLLPDYETREIWLQLGIPRTRVLAFGTKDNFWDMGTTGPCGPCSEIHFVHRGNVDCGHLVNAGSPDVVEIWNLVFMQYNREINQKLLPLPNCHVDTGMGLERITSVLQNTMSNYNTDLFMPIFDRIQKEGSCPHYRGRVGVADIDGVDMAYRIVADHIRMITACIADGLLPDRVDQGQKLRHIIYKCIQQSSVLGMKPGSLTSLVDPVVESLGEAHPVIQENVSRVKEVLLDCEKNYWRSWEEGQKAFRKFLVKRQSDSPIQENELHPLLHGSYGGEISIDMLENLARSFDVPVDTAKLHSIQAQRDSTSLETAKTKDNMSSTMSVLKMLKSQGIPETNDTYKYSYSSTHGDYTFGTELSSKLFVIVQGEGLIQRLDKGMEGGIVLDNTCYYSESGGQASDTGVITSQTGTFCVMDVQNYYNYTIHFGHVREGYISEGDTVTLDINEDGRLGCMRNHTATHLLNAALRKYLGRDVLQQGSNIKHDIMTFDFSSQAKVDNDLLLKIEEDVKFAIKSSFTVVQQRMPLQEALAKENILKLQNETYPGQVFVISVLDSAGKVWSSELCGGTHVKKTSDIGHFTITGVSGQTTKQVTCLTGPYAEWARDRAKTVTAMMEDLQRDVKAKIHHNFWKDRMKTIRHILNTEYLPKVLKEEMTAKADVLNERITTKSTELNLKQLKLGVQQIVAVNREADVAFVDCLMTDPVMVGKALYDVIMEIPVAVFLNSKKTAVVLCMPKDKHVDMQDIPPSMSSRPVGVKKATDNVFVLLTLSNEISKETLKDQIKYMCRFNCKQNIKN